MAYPKTSAKGTMGVTVGLLVLFVLGASLSCDARELIITGLSSKETTASDVSVLQINHQESEGEVKASEVVRIGNMCTMCEEFVTEALEYLKENKTQTEIIDILHNTCSRLLTFEEQAKKHGCGYEYGYADTAKSQKSRVRVQLRESKTKGRDEEREQRRRRGMAIERRRERTGEQRRSRDGRRRSIEGRRRGRSKLQTRSSRSIEASNQVIEVDRSFNQCISLVDYYAPLFFLEIGLVQPGDFCESVNLCSQRVIVSLPLSKVRYN